MASWSERDTSDTEAEAGTPPLLGDAGPDSETLARWNQQTSADETITVVREELLFDDSQIGKGSEMDHVE